MIYRKPIEELKRLTDKRLLAYYKAERNRMFKRGYRYILIDEDDKGEIVMGWYNESDSKYFNDDINYLDLIKAELNTRKHVS